MTLCGFVVALGLAVLIHLRYSWMGFNATDEGFILAYSRRLLEGEIPHLDFISIRPVLSSWLHAPVLYWGGDYTFLISRAVVWLQVTLIILFSILSFQQIKQTSFSFFEITALSLFGFIFTAYNLAPMAWHTLDGIFFTVIGFYFTRRQVSFVRFMGYMLMGCAYLCKQNFTLLPFICLFLFSDWRYIRFWAASLLPGFLYLGYLAFHSAIPDAWLQLNTHTGLFQYGVFNWLLNAKPMILGFLWCGGVSALIFFLNRFALAKIWQCVLTVLLLGILFFPWIFGLYYLPDKPGYVNRLSFFIVGNLFALLVVFWHQGEKSLFRLGIFWLVLAWSASISIGLNLPALVTGVLFVLLAMSLFKNLRQDLAQSPFVVCGFLLFIGVSIALFDRMRHVMVYNEPSAAALLYPLDDVFPGGKGIYTSEHNYRFIQALDEMVDKNFPHYTISILPDFSAYWVKFSQKNPLPIDWLQRTEVATPALELRIKNAIIDFMAKTDSRLIVQKVATNTVAYGNVDEILNNDFFPLLNFIHEEMTLLDENDYFRVYGGPTPHRH